MRWVLIRVALYLNIKLSSLSFHVSSHSQQLPWTLLPPLVNSVLSANEIELELRALLTQHRTVSSVCMCVSEFLVCI